MYATGGAESLAAAVLYVAGMLLPLFGSAAVAAYFGRDKGAGVRIAIYLIVVLGFLFYITMFSEGLEAAARAAGAADYVAIEVPIAVAGAVWLWLGYYIWSRAVSRDSTGFRHGTSG